MSRAAVAIILSEAERRELEGLTRRARIVLAAADGLEYKSIVDLVGTDASTVDKWRRRCAEHRLDWLYDEPRSGAPRKIGDEEIARVVARTLEETPPDGTYWSLRSMARASGYAPSTILSTGSPAGLQPHRSETSCVGPAVCGEGTGHRRGLSRPARARARTLHRREEPYPGAARSIAPSRCCPCDRVRSSGAPSTTCATTPPRCSRRWTSPPARLYRTVFCAPPQQGLPQVPVYPRSPGSRRPRRPLGDGQLRHPQEPCRPALSGPISAGIYTSRRAEPPGSTQWSASSRSSYGTSQCVCRQDARC